MTERVARYMPALLLMAGIFVMSSRSTVPTASGISPTLTAALGHFVVYALLAALVFRALDGDARSLTARSWLAWGLATLYGISDEFHQSFVPGRYATIEDVLLDSAGAATGICLVIAYRTYRRGSGGLSDA